MGNYSIQSIEEPVNKDITVVFTPSNNVISYTYQIYKNDYLISSNDVPGSNPSNIILSDTGTYKIIATENSLAGQNTISSGEYIIDKEKPVITISKKFIETNPANDKNIITCSATDNYDENVTVKTNIEDIPLNKIGKYEYICKAEDEAGNIETQTAIINVVPHNISIYIIQFTCAILLLLLIFRIIKIIKVIKLEERFERYVIKPFKNDYLSTSEKVKKIYSKLLKTFDKIFKKSVIASKYCEKLNKYVPVSDIHKDGYEILSGKIIIASALTLLAIIIKAFQFKLLNSLETLGIFMLGFFILDIYLFAKYKVYRWTLENDFTAAITIMNNSFKSGRSITQAIEIVGLEVKGQIGNEFKRMNLELLYGLDIEEVFKRFAKRVDLEEASYLTASLTILNKTGGDIIKVFSSIERSLFDKRKLRLELKSLTSGSRLIVYVLLAIPFLFALIISLIKEGYFLPFITTPIGKILLIFMIIYYIIFVVVVRKVMKVVI